MHFISAKHESSYNFLSSTLIVIYFLSDFFSKFFEILDQSGVESLASLEISFVDLKLFARSKHFAIKFFFVQGELIIKVPFDTLHDFEILFKFQFINFVNILIH